MAEMLHKLLKFLLLKWENEIKLMKVQRKKYEKQCEKTWWKKEMKDKKQVVE
jgi:hypothetical protein